ncbi:hypothetical protein [Neorhodopirellula lusitana]|uniref:hypothetical protein n=1 Tax=Neorhodopirellula lusitana TaxID=445327 RepID=UPI0024B75BD9|nr:hypothetical protein [Neorhodopirellula lusitana]
MRFPRRFNDDLSWRSCSSDRRFQIVDRVVTWHAVASAGEVVVGPVMVRADVRTAIGRGQ